MGRIIAGRLASRRIHTLPGDLTRPTTDRVRESVFAWLAAQLRSADRDPAEQLAGLNFLDLYAGSGAVGLEAHSRGAQVTWVEQDRSAARVIERNLADTGARGRVAVSPVARFLCGRPAAYDVVWLDPPYDLPTEEIGRVLALLDGNNWLSKGSRVLVERSRRTSAIEFPESFLNVGVRQYGDTVIHHAEKGNE